MTDIQKAMPQRVATARKLLNDEDLPGSAFTHDPELDPPPDPDQLRKLFRKFRRLMGDAGNPGTVQCKGVLRAGWIISSGKVEGHGDEVFYVVMLTNGALHYFSGEIEEPIELTSKWFLGDSIPALEAKMPAGIAEILAANDIDWDDS
ncbi:MAG: hypothetical protein WD602_11225 [Actinomycetota bacterium]